MAAVGVTETVATLMEIVVPAAAAPMVVEFRPMHLEASNKRRTIREREGRSV